MKKLVNKYKFYAQTRPNRLRAFFVVAALLILLGLISIVVAVLIQKDAPQQKQPSPISQQQEVQVAITKDGFLPAVLLVKKGAKITWTNTDDANHQIQANPHPTGESLLGLKSEILGSRQAYEYTADTSGNFGYHDYLNPTTNGTLQVQE